MRAWSQGKYVPSVSVRNKLTSILEESKLKMQSLQVDKDEVQEKLREANRNKAQLTAQLAQLVMEAMPQPLQACTLPKFMVGVLRSTQICVAQSRCCIQKMPLLRMLDHVCGAVLHC